MIYLLDSILDAVTISAAKFNAIAKNIFAGIAQLVERNLAKVEVASSSLVSRSNECVFNLNILTAKNLSAKSIVVSARWQSGYAAACKAVDVGSIPALASIGFSQ